MDPIQAIILGFIQGITEWLPISSTGHLKITEQILGLTLPLLFDVTLHVGTLIVILLFFRKDIKLILEALVKGEVTSENGKMISLIIVGTVPTALIGLALSSTIETYFSSFMPIAAAFLTCGVVLYLSKTGREQKENITYVVALTIGAAQGIALIPGLSRSGLTIAMALLLGLRREKAFKFSFLLSVPAIVGALCVTIYEQHEMLTLVGVGWTEILVGIAVSLIVSYLALKFLWKALANKKFYLFAFYCWLIGVLLLALILSGF
ncbi:MAG: undecaprenyl-diphosphate phosphatase [Candidatus Bathyarchaeota archaeon]|nr:undecaprenyl-diphosphate phosphatase [Candidatus Bathyarchaeota archaeon]